MNLITPVQSIDTTHTRKGTHRSVLTIKMSTNAEVNELEIIYNILIHIVIFTCRKLKLTMDC